MRRAALSLITLLGGVSLAVIPAATVSISSRLFTVEEQGFLAVAVLVATFAGQLTFAVVVESRLSSAATERRVVFPLWLAGISVLTALVLAIIPPNAVALAIGLPILIAALEVGRGVSVAERLDRREIVECVAVGLGALVGVFAGFAEQDWALYPLVAGIAVATCVRCLPVTHHASRPEPAVTAWVVADTAITGVIYPLLNTMILAFLGSADAVLFTSIATVSGLLAIPLNFMRLRLLRGTPGSTSWCPRDRGGRRGRAARAGGRRGVRVHLRGRVDRVRDPGPAAARLRMACRVARDDHPVRGPQEGGSGAAAHRPAGRGLGAHVRARGGRAASSTASRRCSSACWSPSSRPPWSTRSPDGGTSRASSAEAAVLEAGA